MGTVKGIKLHRLVGHGGETEVQKLENKVPSGLLMINQTELHARDGKPQKESDAESALG